MTGAPLPYLVAQRRAIALRHALDAEVARAIVADVRRFADDLAAGVEGLPAGEAAARRAAARIARDAADRLERRIADRIAHGQQVSLDDTLGVWASARADVAAQHGVIPGAALGALPLPDLVRAQAFAALHAQTPGAPWRTLVTTATQQAAAEATEIIRQGIVAGADPTVLARDLRRYVQGGTPDQRAALERAFAGGRLDLRTVPRALKGAAQQVAYNAERIAFSEVHNAGVAADVASFAGDPLVDAVLWRKAVNRGRVRVPDICDVLAANDFYGLGVAAYPVGRVPVPPHPWCRCRRLPRFRSWAESFDGTGAGAVTRAKPSPRLQVTPEDAIIPGGGALTPSAEARIRAQLALLLAA